MVVVALRKLDPDEQLKLYDYGDRSKASLRNCKFLTAKFLPKDALRPPPRLAKSLPQKYSASTRTMNKESGSNFGLWFFSGHPYLTKMAYQL